MWESNFEWMGEMIDERLKIINDISEYELVKLKAALEVRFDMDFNEWENLSLEIREENKDKLLIGRLLANHDWKILSSYHDEDRGHFYLAERSL